jgi:hypothetical protein
MPQKAHVSSLEMLESFRASLLVFLSQARPALEEVSSDVMRTRLWLENDQRTHWQNEIRRRRKELDQAQQSLFSARLGILRQETSTEQLLVQRAKRAVEEAELKLRIVKKWNREYDGLAQPLLKQTEKLHAVLSNDMVKAVAYLTEMIKTLAAYAELRPGGGLSQVAPTTSHSEASQPDVDAEQKATRHADQSQ